MKKLKENIKQLINLSEEESILIEKYFNKLILKKGETLVKAGEYSNKVAFINSGTLRIYYNDLEGNEISCFFMPENNFVSSYTSFLTQTPTKENIEAIEDSELFIITRKRLDELSSEIPKIHIWRRIIAENLFISMERRVSMLHSKSAQERYETMIKEDPNILLKVPLQYIASFIGITPQHLSRLRSKVK